MGGRIVITGSALATALGATRERTWARVVAGECGIATMPALESRPVPDKGGGQAEALPHLISRDRECAFLRHVIVDALRDAALWGPGPDGPLAGYNPARAGVVMGTTLHGMRAAGEFLRSDDPRHLAGFLAGSVLARTLEGIPFRGPRLSNCSACSSGLGAVALAVTLLETGAADVVIAGGYDPVSEYAYAGFESLRLVASGPSRPFGIAREGMKIAEGYAALVLERAPDARARHARIHGAVLGFGESADAHHLTQPHPQGEGAARAIRAALDSARLARVDLISAHATGTTNNDAAEYAAYRAVFPDSLADLPVVAFKAALGHTLGAAGAVELVLTTCARRDGIIPPTPNSSRDDLEFPLALRHGRAGRARLRTTLSTSLGFGGANTCIIVGDEPQDPPPPAPSPHRVAISGCGVVLPGMPNREALARLFLDGERLRSGAVPEEAFAHAFAARRARRLSNYAKMTLASASLALDDAAILERDAWCDGARAILGTTHASTEFCQVYYTQIVREGLGAANPMLFAEGVPNAGAAQLSLALSIRGGCQTIIGTRTSGLDALALAAARLRMGLWDRAIVSAGEEAAAVIARGYQACNPAHRGDLASGAISLTLERADALERRGGRALAWLDRWAWSCEAATGFDHLLRDIGSPREVAIAPGWASRLGSDRESPELFSAAPFVAIAAWLGGWRARPGVPAGFLADDLFGTATGITLVGAIEPPG